MEQAILDENCILTRLRTETAEHHQSIENAIPVMKPTLTKEEYIQILRRFHRFHQDFESEIQKQPVLLKKIPDLSQRLKLALLEKDLQFFSAICPQTSESTQSLIPVAGHSVSAALGAMYVMEGSTLGGQVISRHLKKQLDVDAENGAAYYNAYGASTGKMWQTFKELLKTHLQTDEEKAEAVHAAQKTFSALQSQMMSPISE